MAPLLATRGSASIRGFGRFGNTISDNFFANLYDSNDQQGFGAVVDSSGNLYVSGSNDTKVVVAKFNSTGTIQWQKSYEGTTNAYYNKAKLAIDSSSNIYLAYVASGKYQVIKYDSSGTLQWRSDAIDCSTRNAEVQNVKLDSAGNIWINSSHDSLSGGYDGWIAKFNSSGVLQSQKRCNGGNDTFEGGLAIYTGNDNMYGAGMSSYPGYNITYLMKMDSSANKVWCRSLNNSNNGVRPGCVTVDSSENVYVGAHGSISGTNHMFIAKWNSSGTLQWQRKVAAPSASIIPKAMATDSSGNLYVTGWTDGTAELGTTGGVDGLILKYDSSGTLQYQRKVFANAGGVNEEVNDIVIDNTTSSMYMVGYSDGGGGCLMAYRFPTDGSRTGTYSLTGVANSQMKYVASSMTESAASLTEANETTMALSTTSLSVGTSSLSSNTTTLTSYKVNI